MYSTSHLANQYNWLPANINVNMGTSNRNTLSANVKAGNFGAPFDIGIPPTFGGLIPGTLINPNEEKKYGVGNHICVKRCV